MLRVTQHQGPGMAFSEPGSRSGCMCERFQQDQSMPWKLEKGRTDNRRATAPGGSNDVSLKGQ